MLASCNILNFISTRKEIVKTNLIDKEEFTNLIEEYKIPLYRLTIGIVKNEHDAQDIINNAILKGYENLSKLRKRENFKAWIMKIAVNECYTVIKKKKRVDLQADMTIYDVAYEDKDNHELMDEINRLDVDLRTILILFYYEDLSIKEISDVLKIPEGTVKSRLSRAKNKLKILLREE